jgi:hypothetical protein
MKAVLGWLKDPYIHIFVVGLVLVRLAMGTGGDESADPAADRAITCAVCQSPHPAGKSCPQVASRLQDFLQRDR